MSASRSGARVKPASRSILNHLRFNFYQPTEPRRDQLAYSIVWEGWIAGDATSQPHTFYLTTSKGVRGEFLVDGRPVIPMGEAIERTGAVALSRGWHAVTVRVGVPNGSDRRVEAGEIADRVRRPFDARRVFPAQVGATRLAVNAIARWIARGLDLTVLLWLAALVIMGMQQAWRQARSGRLLWFAVIIEALLFALPYSGRAAVLSGGDDWLMYEHLARAIAFGDPLLREPGLGAGHGTPFYFQAFYPYFVAITHLLFGEGIFGVVFVQRLLLGAATGWIAATATRLFGERTGWVALGIGGLLMYAKGGRWAAVLLAEPLFMPLLAWWTWLLVRTATEGPRWPRLVLTGAIGGLATLVRSTLFLALPIVLPLWSAAIRPRRARATVVLLASLVAVLGLLTLRTWMVTGAFVLAPSSGGVALFVGNEPPRPLDAAPPGRTAVYSALRLEAPTRTVVEYAFQLPGEFIDNLARKAVYTVGLFERSGIDAVGVGVPDASWLYVALWCLALVGAVRILRAPDGLPWPIVLLPGLLALSHFAAVVLILPHWYGDRLILPLYPLLVPYAAFGLEPLVHWAHNRAERTAAAVLVALALCVFVTGSPRMSDVVILLVFGALVLAITTGPRPCLTRQAWLYYGYAAALLVAYADTRRSGSGGDFDLAAALLLPLAAFAVTRLARARLPYAVTIAEPWLSARLSRWRSSGRRCRAMETSSTCRAISQPGHPECGRRRPAGPPGARRRCARNAERSVPADARNVSGHHHTDRRRRGILSAWNLASGAPRQRPCRGPGTVCHGRGLLCGAPRHMRDWCPWRRAFTLGRERILGGRARCLVRTRGVAPRHTCRVLIDSLRSSDEDTMSARSTGNPSAKSCHATSTAAARSLP